MVEALCGVCNTNDKKYKCPTCSLPYCSIICFKEHKLTHPDFAPTPVPRSTEPDLPNPPPPKPVPKYLRSKTDYSVLATNPKFHDILKSHPPLLSTLQKVYAATIEPEPDEPGPGRRGRGGFRGRGRARGRGGRGGRGRWHGMQHEEVRWTQKKGDASAMRFLKGIREGKQGEEEMEGVRAFVDFVQEVVGQRREA